MKIRRERVSAAPAQACFPQRTSRVDRDLARSRRQAPTQFPTSRKPTSGQRPLESPSSGITSRLPVIFQV
jgi:hypothetical protein